MSTTTVAKKVVTTRVTTTDTVVLAMELSTTTVTSHDVVTTTVTATSMYAKGTTTKTITMTTMASAGAVLPGAAGPEKIVTSPLSLHFHVAWMVVAIVLLCVAAVTCTFGLTAFAVYVFRWRNGKRVGIRGSKTSIGERFTTLKDVGWFTFVYNVFAHVFNKTHNQYFHPVEACRSYYK